MSLGSIDVAMRKLARVVGVVCGEELEMMFGVVVFLYHAATKRKVSVRNPIRVRTFVDRGRRLEEAEG